MTRKHVLVLLAASTLTAAVGLPALGGLRDPTDGGRNAAASRVDDDRVARPLVLASGNEDRDHDDRDNRRASRERDRDHDDDGDDECDDDDDCGDGAAPVPAAPGKPPRDGLFGTGAPPQVKVN